MSTTTRNISLGSQKAKQIYAGIGSRETPVPICNMMTSIAEQLGEQDWMLRSGFAERADQAFQAGAKEMEIHLPWRGYNHAPENYPFVVPKPTKDVIEVASRFHPRWDELTDAVKLLMCRNVTIVLGQHLDEPVKMVICWTRKAQLVGGTAHGMKVAYAYDIPVFNMALIDDQQALNVFLARF